MGAEGRGGGGGGGGEVVVYCFHVVHLSIIFWFLLTLLNDLRYLFIFGINVDIDKMLLLHKNKSQGINSFRVISLCNS